ncbi:MAG: hypothetical protein GY716_00320 [bacterium]|nr:hypothetical protein [bacterium]
MNGEDRGIELLRDSVERVAHEIEQRETPRRTRRPSWRVAAAAALLLAGAAAVWLARPEPRAAEVQVLKLTIRGRAVRAAVVEDGAPDTIVVMPRRENALIGTTAPLRFGGDR